MSEPQGKTVAALASDVERLSGVLKDCQERSAVARREETAALIGLNQAQRQLDESLAVLRNSAPNGTNWKTPSGLSE